MLSPTTGIYIAVLNGEVTIADNDIGTWTDDYAVTYVGNSGDGIRANGAAGGAMLTIGPNNRIVENTEDGIEIGSVGSGASVGGGSVGSGASGGGASVGAVVAAGPQAVISIPAMIKIVTTTQIDLCFIIILHIFF